MRPAEQVDSLEARGQGVKAMRATVLACLLMGQVPLHASAADLERVPAGDPESSAFAALAQEFFDAVRTRDHEGVLRTTDAYSARDLRPLLQDPGSHAYRRLYEISSSPGARFATWRGVDWLAARDPTLRDKGGSAILCWRSEDASGGWPPIDRLWKDASLRGLVCIPSFVDEGGRSLSLMFLVEEAAPEDPDAPGP